MSTDDRNIRHDAWNAANAQQDREPRPEPRPQPHPAGPAGPGISWPLVLGLGAVALLRPLARIVGVDDAVGAPATALALTLLVTGAWVAIVGLGRVPRPVLTLTLAGLAYGVYVIPLSAILSVGLDGTLQGPVAVPFAVVPLLATNALWGAVAGLLALVIQNLRREKP